MTLHHIENIPLIIKRFYDLLNQDGYLCIADLDKEDGSFHSRQFDGHHGFDQSDLAETLKEQGFKHVDSQISFVQPKKNKQGVERDYPIFLMIGKK